MARSSTRKHESSLKRLSRPTAIEVQHAERCMMHEVQTYVDSAATVQQVRKAMTAECPDDAFSYILHVPSQAWSKTILDTYMRSAQFPPLASQR